MSLNKIYLFSTILSAFRTCGGVQPFSVSKILELKEHLDDSGISSFYNEHSEIAVDEYSDVQELYLEQRLDHFASRPDVEPFSFSQRYFYTDRFIHDTAKNLRGARGNSQNESSSFNSGDKPVRTYALICVGGEGPSLDKSVLTNSVHCSGDMLETAKILYNERHANVHLFALEHRYYGKSYPSFGDGISPVVNENLVYLSSRQALADLAHFVEYVRDDYDIADNVPFVTFGGSYPGMLAAWSRLKYPHLIAAAVSNSAPIEVILDFTEYKNVVAKDLSNTIVGGSQQCLDIVEEGHKEIADTLQNGGEEGIESVASLFNLCDGADSLRDKKSLRAFLGDGVVFLDVQSNDPSCDDELCNISKFCDFVTEESVRFGSTPMNVLGKLSKKMSSGECKDISWEAMISFLSSPEAIAEGTRSWLWQTCTEVGFYQTCEVGSACPYGKGFHNIDADMEICERAFGINESLVRENVNDTLNYYGGWSIQGSKILATNGDIDPWSAMSYSNSGRHESDGNELDSYWSIGASHHFWTHEMKDTDGLGVMATRSFIYNWVLSVLDEESGLNFDSSSVSTNDILSME